jgi:hypothetical protein
VKKNISKSVKINLTRFDFKFLDFFLFFLLMSLFVGISRVLLTFFEVEIAQKLVF